MGGSARVSRRFTLPARFLAASLFAAVFAVVTTSTSFASDGSVQDLVFDATNNQRASVGVAALAPDDHLRDLAQAWADALSEQETLSHNPELPGQMADWWAWGENIGYGRTIDAIERAWWNSPSHRDNLLSADYTFTGVGVSYLWGRLIIVQVFGG